MDTMQRKRVRAINYHNKKSFGGIKYDILQRDNFKCTICGISEKEHVELFERELTVHHKDEDRKNNTLENLITVCNKCHQKIHHKSEIDGSLILSARASGRTFQSIAKEFGVTRQRVYQIYKKLST